MRVRILAMAAALAAIASPGLGTPAGAASGDRPFAEQADAAGLTEAQADALQLKVDDYLKKLGGKQVALNKIEFEGTGRLLVALPGEARPRDFASGAGQRLLDSPCLDGMYNGWFCAFPRTGFQGDDLSWYTCGTYTMPWAGTGSWRNNQTRGTRAIFYNGSGGVHYTTPGAYSSSTSYNWTPVYRIKIC